MSNKTYKPVDNLPEQRWKPNRKLTKKQNEFVKELINDPKISDTEAAMRAYNTKNRNSAGSLAALNRKNPVIMAELEKYASTAESNLIKLANKTTEYAMEGGRDGASYAAVARQTNDSILDRIHGKATQKIEQTSKVVTINVDLSGLNPT